MKKLVPIVVLMSISFSLFSQSTIKEVEVCNCSGHVIIPSDETWVCHGNLTIAGNTTIDGKGELVAKNAVTLNGAVVIKKSSSVTFENGLTLAKGANLVNKGSLRMFGNVTMLENAKFYNYNTSLIVGGSFTGVTGVTFSNEANAVFQICNAPGNTANAVDFGIFNKNVYKYPVANIGLYFKEGSTFMSNNTDVNIFVDMLSTCVVEGAIDMIDSNLSFDCDNHSKIVFATSALVKVLDVTFPYSDKGRLELAERATVNVKGNVYATGFRGNFGSHGSVCARAVTLWYDYRNDHDCPSTVIVKSSAGGSYEDFLNEAYEMQPVEFTQTAETKNTDVGHNSSNTPPSDTILAEVQ